VNHCKVRNKMQKLNVKPWIPSPIVFSMGSSSYFTIFLLYENSTRSVWKGPLCDLPRVAPQGDYGDKTTAPPEAFQPLASLAIAAAGPRHGHGGPNHQRWPGGGRQGPSSYLLERWRTVHRRSAAKAAPLARVVAEVVHGCALTSDEGNWGSGRAKTLYLYLVPIASLSLPPARFDRFQW
jgi:hypothetical protein